MREVTVDPRINHGVSWRYRWCRWGIRAGVKVFVNGFVGGNRSVIIFGLF